MDLAAQGGENLAYFATTDPGKYASVLEPLPAKPFGVLMKKGDTQLANAVKDAFAEIVDSGEYQKILDKWGSATVPWPPRSTASSERNRGSEGRGGGVAGRQTQRRRPGLRP